MQSRAVPWAASVLVDWRSLFHGPFCSLRMVHVQNFPRSWEAYKAEVKPELRKQSKPLAMGTKLVDHTLGFLMTDTMRCMDIR